MKKNIDSGKENFINKKTMIKFVKKAQMWCKTTWDEYGVQSQEWSVDKPTVEDK